MNICKGWLFGFLLGIIAPALSFILIEYFKIGQQIGIRDSAVYLWGVGLNLLLLKYLFGRGKEQEGKAVLLITFLTVLLIFILKIYR